MSTSALNRFLKLTKSFIQFSSYSTYVQKSNLEKNRNKVRLVKQIMKLKLNNAELKGMKELDREKFRLNIKVPAIKLKKFDYHKLKSLLKHFALDLTPTLKKLQDVDDTHKYILLDPDQFDLKSLNEDLRANLIESLKKINKSDANIQLESVFEYLDVQLTYEDFKFDDIMRAVIPDELLNENVNVKGYSIIGHIAHFNLKDKILDYKNLIGSFFILFFLLNDELID